MNKKLTIINIALVLVAVFLAYMVYRSISRPVIFENTKRAREEKVVQNLKGIRDAQDLFKEEYNRYTASFDSLVAFVKTGQLPIVNRIQDPNDTTFTKTISVERICDQYINQLRCTYDVTSGYCYYYIPNTIRCVGTNSCLLDVIRLIEYGNNYVPPMNWVRHSYLEFVDYIEGKGNK